MTRLEFHQELYDSMKNRFNSLNENWQSFTESLRDIQQGGTVSNELAVTYLAHSAEMLGLRIQYLQAALLALTGGAIVEQPEKEIPHNLDELSNSGPEPQTQFLGRCENC